ncbi:hypothetical protein EYF80_037047 [Liparis tanakae]|uniref:Uncharacterized protein n=1 Tax=Liparis tanakae TaxID=230148 RepID=A0A4Z2GIQ0_9TELE|nr:hypothetical protein EYF80_037047 [Liparis tanakae]
MDEVVLVAGFLRVQGYEQAQHPGGVRSVLGTRPKARPGHLPQLRGRVQDRVTGERRSVRLAGAKKPR